MKEDKVVELGSNWVQVDMEQLLGREWTDKQLVLWAVGDTVCKLLMMGLVEDTVCMQQEAVHAVSGKGRDTEYTAGGTQEGRMLGTDNHNHMVKAEEVVTDLEYIQRVDQLHMCTVELELEWKVLEDWAQLEEKRTRISIGGKGTKKGRTQSLVVLWCTLQMVESHQLEGWLQAAAPLITAELETKRAKIFLKTILIKI